ncbi:MAG TPA: hypothetical protein VLA90_11445, partial [Actinomycetota bacterium]|nr:hypothetical protein [Actinomycetota bacterium]
AATMALLLAACTTDEGGGDPDPTGATGGPTGTTAPTEPMRLEVFVYNVEYGGDETTDAVIEVIDADVVGVLESYNRLPETAERTAYPYHNTSLQILSKYPIHEPSGADGRYAFIEVRPGEVVAFFNIHLDYVRYGPRRLRNGASLEDVLASENEVRTSSLEVPLAQMRDLIARGFPVFFTGDHNEPSHLDYGAETVGTREGIDEPVPWPVSLAVADAGFRDTYREIHPDPLADPAISHFGVKDRIDFLYSAGPSVTLDSRLVGEEGGEGVDEGFDPWTSDHRAFASTFEVTPVPMPVMISVHEALLDRGDLLTIGYRAPEDGSIAIVPAGAGADSARQTESATGETGRIEGLDTSALDPGAFDAVLLDGGGGEVARVGFVLRDPEAVIRVSTDKTTYEPGEPIVVSWESGPAHRWDWLGVYEARRADPKVDYYLVWNYTGLHGSGKVPPVVDGSVTFDESTMGGPWPLPPGRYVVHYLVTDRYRSIGSAAFEVAG